MLLLVTIQYFPFFKVSDDRNVQFDCGHANVNYTIGRADVNNTRPCTIGIEKGHEIRFFQQPNFLVYILVLVKGYGRVVSP